MNRNLFLSFAIGVGLLGILGCTGQPSEEENESQTAPVEQPEATDQTVVFTEDFESGQVEADSDSPAGELPEEGDTAEKADPD